MVNKLLILLLVVSCGKEVNISNKKLESFSSVTEAESVRAQDTGILKRLGEEDLDSEIITSSGTYRPHQGSSHHARSFMKSQPVGSQLEISFKGTIKTREIVLEEIHKK